MNAAQFAKLCGVSAGTVSSWCDAGMPCVRTGRMGSSVTIDLMQAIPWVVKERAPPPGSERERLARAQAEKFELENARRRGELTLVSFIAEVLNSMAADIAARLDGLPGRLANELSGIADPARIRERLLEECRSVRSGIAEHVRKLAEHKPAIEDGGEDLGSASGKKLKRVGRRKPNPAARKRRARTVEE